MANLVVFCQVSNDGKTEAFPVEPAEQKCFSFDTCDPPGENGNPKGFSFDTEGRPGEARKSVSKNLKNLRLRAAPGGLQRQKLKHLLRWQASSVKN